MHDKSYPTNCKEFCICRPVTTSKDNEVSVEENLFQFDLPSISIKDQNDKIEGVDGMSEWMRWHYRLGHMSFRKMKILCTMGFLPKRFLKLKNPKCAGCLYGSMTRQPWRNKGQSNVRSIHKSSRPGQCISIDQMESSTPGFIAHTKGILTRHRYTSATIFVDHFSRLSSIHMQKSLSSEDTLPSKYAFESYAKKRGVMVLHYHADNGRFADNLFMKSVRDNKQTISFCGVNAHFQNGIAEKCIRDLQDGARRLLLHAKSRWSKAIHDSLWPYALLTFNTINNQLPDLVNGSCKVEKFTNVSVAPRLKSFHTWGCPVFALDDNLQSGKKINKWNTRCRLGVSLGHSPRHAASVSLVLNLKTGNISRPNIMPNMMISLRP